MDPDQHPDIFCLTQLINLSFEDIYIFICKSLTRFVNAMVYYGLTLKAGDFGSNRYISIAMVGLIEIPADIIALYFMDRSVAQSFL